MPPSTQPSISQITFPSLLEVRTPIAFSYLGNNNELASFSAATGSKIHQHRPQLAALAHQHLQRHPPNNAPRKTPPLIEQKCARTMTLKSTPNSTPQDTQPSILRKSTSTPNRISEHHPSCMPPCTLQSRSKNAPAPSPACPIAPERQYPKVRPHRHQHLKQLPTNCIPQHHQQQHPKLHSPLRPTVKMQKCARTVTTQNCTYTSTPNCMPPSTLPSILKRCTRTAISTSNSTPISTYTSTRHQPINLANHFPLFIRS